MKSVVQIQNVSRTYWNTRGEKVDALSGISLDVSPGELVCLLGPTGCGKTTLLRLVAGLEVPDQGSILLKQ